jgi:glycosyltransferase involved in cell wall biosynthesis
MGDNLLALSVLVWCVLVLAIVPTALFIWNLILYRPPKAATWRRSVSVLIPARDEERSIGKSVRAALGSRDIDLELIVLDDHSADRTEEIVRSIGASDARLRYLAAPPLPPGWCGKQFACSVLAEQARHDFFCFLDADVEVAPDGIARMVEQLVAGGTGLISGFPQQVTGTFLERLLLPLMHFLLLGYLPLVGMRKLADPSFGAGCGQIFVTGREAYFQAGGHAAIRHSRHDGLSLPRTFRRAGIMTDFCDATPVASCRMYHNANEVLGGLLKNATEGLAAPGRIVPFSLILLIGQVLPLAMCVYVFTHPVARWLTALAVLSLVLSYLPRFLAALRFKQPFLAALFHPLSVFVLLAIQWVALVRSFRNVPATWKGRRYSTT